MRRCSAATLALLAAVLASPAGAQGCLAPAERRQAIASGDAVPLRVAVEAVRASVPGRLIRADLCQGSGGLVYRLSMLEPRGAIRFALVDGKSGRLLSVR